MGSGKKESKEYNMPVGAHIIVNNGEAVQTGQILAKIPRIIGKLRDITGGLPRVTEIFEARRPKETAIMAEISGEVEIRADKNVIHGRVVEVLGIVKKHGIENVGIAVKAARTDT